jgi:hypothetical protein
MKRYAIWDKMSPVIVPTGAVFTAEQWMEKYPVAALDYITIVCAAGEINGGFFGTLGQMVKMYEDQGCDFSTCTTAEEKLAAIEAFDEAKEADSKAKAQAKADEEAAIADMNASSLASIAASMEYQNMLTLEDAEEV